MATQLVVVIRQDTAGCAEPLGVDGVTVDAARERKRVSLDRY